MASGNPFLVESYWQTSYRPDCEYIDGEIRERNVGKWEHARLLALLSGWLEAHEQQWNCIGATSLRVTVSPTRVRVPDLVLFASNQAFTDTVGIPLLIVEILSSDDTDADTRERTTEYQNMGIENIWIIDLKTKMGRMSIHTEWVVADCLEVPGTSINVHIQTLLTRLQRPSA